MGLKRRTKRHHNNTPICFAHLSGCSTNHLGLGLGLGLGYLNRSIYQEQRLRDDFKKEESADGDADNSTAAPLK